MVIVMLSAFLLMAILILNPIAQLNKAKDAQRKQDLEQIRSALDTYYNDTGCYPALVPFGGEWKVGNTVYMKKVPQDPDCYTGGYCYVYQANNSGSCPQWNVLYTHLLVKMTATELQKSCPLRTVCGVLFTRYNYCIFSGNLDCTYIKTNPMPTPNVSLTPTPTSTPAPTPTPTPTPVPTPTPTPIPTPTPTSPPYNCSPNSYFAVSAGRCNSVSSNQCTIYGGTLTCYSGPGILNCSGFLCTQ